MPDLQDAGRKPISDLVVDVAKNGKATAEEPSADKAGQMDAADRAMDAVKAGDRAGYIAATEDLVRIFMRKYS